MNTSHRAKDNLNTIKRSTKKLVREREGKAVICFTPKGNLCFHYENYPCYEEKIKYFRKLDDDKLKNVPKL